MAKLSAEQRAAAIAALRSRKRLPAALADAIASELEAAEYSGTVYRRGKLVAGTPGPLDRILNGHESTGGRKARPLAEDSWLMGEYLRERARGADRKRALMELVTRHGVSLRTVQRALERLQLSEEAVEAYLATRRARRQKAR